MNSLAHLLLGCAVALIFCVLPIRLAIPFGHESIHHLIGGLALASGALLGASRFRMRIGVAGGALLAALVGERVLARGIANWSLRIEHIPQIGALPVGVVATAIVFLLPIGLGCGALQVAMCATTVAFWGGACCGVLSAPVLGCGVIGISGTIALAMSMLALACVLWRAPGGGESVASRSWATRTLALAAGLALGILSLPFGAGAGGTGFASAFLPACVLFGVVVGRFVSVPLRSDSCDGVSFALALAAAIAGIAAVLPSVAEIAASSQRIAGAAGGNLPALATLHPLPLLALAVGSVLGASNVVGRSFDASCLVLGALLGQIVPRGEFESRAWLIACVLGCVLVAIPRARRPQLPGAGSSHRWVQFAASILLLAVACERSVRAIAAMGEARAPQGDVVREIDGARFEIAGGGGDARDRLDGVLVPLEGSAAENDLPVARIALQLLALGESPRRCLVLGRGGASLAQALLELSAAEITLVTPSSGEYESLRRRFAMSSRVHSVHAVPRAFLAANRAPFDLIVVASPQLPWERYGLDHTSEYREAIVARLAPGGLAAQAFALSAAQPANMVSRFITDAMLDREEALLILDHPRSANPWVAVAFGDGVRRVRFADLDARLASIVGSVERLARAGLDARGLLQCCLADGTRYRLENRLPTRNRDDRPWLAVSAHAAVAQDRANAIAGLDVLMRTRCAIESRIEFEGSDRDATRSLLRRDYQATEAFLGWRTSVSANCASDAIDPPSTLGELDAMLLALPASPDLAWLRTPLLRGVAALSRGEQRSEARLLLDRLADAERAFAFRRDAVPGRDPVQLRLALGRFLARSGQRARAIAEFEGLPEGEHSPVVEFEIACLHAFEGRAARARSVAALEAFALSPQLNSAERSRAEFALAYARRDRDRMRVLLEAGDARTRDAAQRAICWWLEP